MYGWENLRDEDAEIILRGVEAGKALGGPFHVEIDPMDACNADCVFCGSALVRSGNKTFEWTRLEPLLDELIAGGLRSARFAGGGEPTLYPQLGPLCEKLAGAGVVLDNLTTNGLALNDQRLEHLLKMDVSSVLVSLNYTRPDIYEKFMRTRPGSFETVVETIHRLHEALEKKGVRDKTLLQTQFFIHRSSVEEMPRMMEFARTLPVNALFIHSIWGIPEDEIMRPEDIERVREHLPGIVEAAADGPPWLELDMGNLGLQPYCSELLSEMRSRFAPAHAPGNDPAEKIAEYCYIGWYSMVLQGNGDVHPCCFLMQDDRVPPMGNLKTQSLAEVWHGPMYQKHREEMRTAMLFQKKTPGQERRFTCTLPMCWKSDECPLAKHMATPAFYADAHHMLERLRKRPATRLARAANSLSRAAIDKGKALARR